MAKQRVFLDTNVIIEAFRTRCWSAICGRFAVETVASVVAEALAGDPTEPGYVVVEEGTLKSGLAAIHEVTPLMRAALGLRHQEAEGLDLGERDLLAWLLAQGPNALPSSGTVYISVRDADKAAIVVTGRLQWLDHLACLASLAQEAGITRHQVEQFREHFKAKWLDAIRMKVRLGVIP